MDSSKVTDIQTTLDEHSRSQNRTKGRHVGEESRELARAGRGHGRVKGKTGRRMYVYELVKEEI